MSQSKGSAAFKDSKEWIAWYSNLSDTEADAIYDEIENADIRDKQERDIVVDNVYRMYHVQGSYGGINPENFKSAKWEKQLPDRMKFIDHFFDLTNNLGQIIQIAYWNDLYAALHTGNPKICLIVYHPNDFLFKKKPQDFSDLTPLQVKMKFGMSERDNENNLVPTTVQSTLSINTASIALNNKKQAIEHLKNEMENVEAAKSGELNALRIQIEAMQKKLEEKKQTMMTELKRKMEEMESLKEKLEMQIYLLDAQIYSILCFAGETIQFAQIRQGQNAPDNEPIVIHQKLHFLDEDLGRLASLYEIDWDHIDMFEEFLKYNSTAFETFTPNQRCVSLVRLSRTGRQFSQDNKNPYSNMLRDYDYFHGKTVGILIRNGENLYLGWTDESRVHINDDLIFNQTIPSPTSDPDSDTDFLFESDRKRHEKQTKQKQKEFMDGIISRTYVYSILQGVIERTSWLPLPAGTTLDKESNLIVYSIADKWLTDNRFGDFTVIIERCNQRIQKGDALLTVQRLVPEREYSLTHGYYSHAWTNVRGRGNRNRTHDAVVNDCSIYTATVVEYEEPVSMTRYRTLIKPDFWALRKDKNAKPYWQERTIPTAQYKPVCYEDGSQIPEGEQDQILEVFDYRKRHVFVSALKTEDWRYSTEAHASVEVYPEEIINLTYMNSVWLEWAITNKKLGNWTVGGEQIDYAYAIRYLKTALDYVRVREKEEKAILDSIDPSICLNKDWPLILSEWKLEKKVRILSKYQAKRYANSLKKEG